MENDNVIHGLTRKRAELAGEIDHFTSVVQQKMIELDHLDAAIRIFRPDIDLETVKAKTVPPRHQALPGEMIRGVLTVLRETKEPIASNEITLRLMKRRDELRRQGARPDSDETSDRLFAPQSRKGLLKSSKAPEQQLLWEIAR